MGTSTAKAQQASAPITQRDINKMTASVEDARSALINNAGLRQPGEDLNAYLRRIALPLAVETPFRYQSRIQGYFNLLNRTVPVAREWRRMPALRDNSATNRALWERTVHALQLLPARVTHTHSAWNHVQQAIGASSNEQIAARVKTARFDMELAQTVSMLIAIDDGLRDARP